MPKSEWRFTLMLLREHVCVCRVDPTEPVPEWAFRGGFFSVTRTDEELSIVCAESAAPVAVRKDAGWRVIKIQGPFEFTAVGVLAAIVIPLREAAVSILAVSTFDTDYVLVKHERLDAAAAALIAAGHRLLVVER